MAEVFTCQVDEKYRSACKDLPKYPGTRYCVLHYPDEAKNKEDFEEVKKGKLDRKDYDFSGTVFPKDTSNFERVEFDADTYFTDATFIGGAQFRYATFSGEEISFTGAQFSAEDTSFEEAQFSSAELTDFSRAQFSGGWTDFSRAQFSSERTNFRGAQFSSERTNFRGAQFSGEDTSFGEAQFSGEFTFFADAQFSGEDTSFREAQFSSAETDFGGARFSGRGTVFSLAQFSSEWTTFEETQFSGEFTNFGEAQFSGELTFFADAQFSGEWISFNRATFKEKILFWGSQGNLLFGSAAWAHFNYSRIEKPELLTFNSVLLHPGWFINADVRRVDFTDVKWYGMPGGLEEGSLDEEIVALTKRDVESPHVLLSQACQRLSANAEENRDYPLANEFHYWSQDALRKGSWRSFGLIRTLYWALSGYGVRTARAFLVLMGMWAAFTTLYVLVDPSEFKHFGQGIGYLWQATVYSLLAMARLNPEPRPAEPGLFQFLVGLEGILGPLQIALLALAIRRKVMR